VLSVLRLLAGIALLLAGRRLFWLFVAAIGFLAGLELAPRLLPGQSDIVIVIVAAVVALAGALVAVAFQTIVIGVAGFLGGAAAGVLLLRTLGFDSDGVVLAVGLVGGLIGALVSFVLFDWALIVLSSLAGASLIVGEVARLVALPSPAPLALVIALAVVGVLVQARLLAQVKSPRA
jgi:hypothetical protein